MEPPNLTVIMKLKKDLAYAIEKNNYNLLSPEIIDLSKKLDHLMLPLFTVQIQKDSI